MAKVNVYPVCFAFDEVCSESRGMDVPVLIDHAKFEPTGRNVFAYRVGLSNEESPLRYDFKGQSYAIKKKPYRDACLLEVYGVPERLKGMEGDFGKRLEEFLPSIKATLKSYQMSSEDKAWYGSLRLKDSVNAEYMEASDDLHYVLDKLYRKFEKEMDQKLGKDEAPLVKDETLVIDDKLKDVLAKPLDKENLEAALGYLGQYTNVGSSFSESIGYMAQDMVKDLKAGHSVAEFEKETEMFIKKATMGDYQKDELLALRELVNGVTKTLGEVQRSKEVAEMPVEVDMSGVMKSREQGKNKGKSM